MEEERLAEEEYDRHVDYKAMYKLMVRAASMAANILIQAQQECEEMYLRAGDEFLGE